MLDEIDVIILGLQDWIERAENGEIKRSEPTIQLKRTRLRVLGAIRNELEKLK
jgi:hypothetical protein